MSDTLPVYSFPGSATADIAAVGGKAFSLLKASQAGLPVPAGFVLPVEFFAAWMEVLKKRQEWLPYIELSGADSSNADWQKACHSLKNAAALLSLSEVQLLTVSESLQTFSSESLFAVRSSSPEEDLEGTSFAGGYETVLGVTTAKMEAAIKHAFASCLDYRIAAYKRERGFDLADPKIAVVIQEQIASEVAGVGFSLNPVTNNYDEAVINSNWGLGESVVSGAVTPDSFVVDKVSSAVRSTTVGSKETSIWLLPHGGTEERTGYKSNETTLCDSQLTELTQLIKDVEKLYGKPIDIEWAFAGGRLYLLQARPITAYVPLPPELVTAAGKRKRLYLDFTISLQGLYKPLSPMSTSQFKRMVAMVGRKFGVSDLFNDIDSTLPIVTSGRLYLNLSNALRIAGKKQISDSLENVDPLAAKTLLQIKESEYRSENKQFDSFPFRVAPHLSFPAVRMAEGLLRPDFVHPRCQEVVQRFMVESRKIAEKQRPFVYLHDQLFEYTWNTIYSVPLLIASRVALEAMKIMVPAAAVQDLSKLELALPNNVTTEMGLALFRIAKTLPDNIDSPQLKAIILAQGTESGGIDCGAADGAMIDSRVDNAAFSRAWSAFLDKYGHRGPQEIDIAQPRYRDDPTMLIDLLVSFCSSKGSDNPEEQFKRNQEVRRSAYNRLYAGVRKRGWWQAKLFAHLYEIVETLGGYRETHKFCIVFIIDLLRQKILKRARKLLAQKRLHTIDQVFDLTLEDLDRSLSDQSLDLISIAQSNRRFSDRLARVPQLPTMIDSRGLILRPPAVPFRNGQVSGAPISAGVARGRIKVLHAADEKPFLKGEILVARATDPGWTPLFINAAAIILEVGGVLQHGALVAREYGLPCVAGIAGATSIWSDGTLVEVDGSAGIVRTLTEAQDDALAK